MRKFFFENETGARKPLNGEQGVWVENPTGLGFSTTEKYSDNTNGFYSRYHSTIDQGNVVFDLVFTKEAYKTYNNLMSWLVAAQRLFLVYQPYGATAYYTEVRIKSITKKELTEGKWLRIPTSLTCLTPWYKPTPLTLSLEKQRVDAMRYPFAYNSELHYGISDMGDFSAQLPSGGHIAAGLKISYIGAAKDLDIALWKDSELIGRCALDGLYNGTIELQTGYNDSHIYYTDTNGQTTDLLDSLDITQNPFFKLPTEAANYILKLTGDGELDGTAKATINYYYRSV